MDMKSLFNDFKNYVDAMDIQAVKKNIQEAVEHSADSHILDGQIDEYIVQVKHMLLVRLLHHVQVCLLMYPRGGILLHE